LRKLRIAAPTQLVLSLPEVAMNPADRWWSLPERVQTAALSLLARMISDGVVDSDEEVTGDVDC
jgi:hypothetical protein